jgi:hypothetical protein
METVLVSRDDAGVVTLTLNRPEKKNAIDTRMWHEILSVLDEVAESRDDRVLVVTGAGDAFTSGADLTGPGAGDVAQGVGTALHAMRLVGRCALRLHDLPKPTIAKVGVAVHQRHCVGEAGRDRGGGVEEPLGAEIGEDEGEPGPQLVRDVSRTGPEAVAAREVDPHVAVEVTHGEAGVVEPAEQRLMGEVERRASEVPALFGRMDADDRHVAGLQRRPPPASAATGRGRGGDDQRVDGEHAVGPNDERVQV